MSPFPASLTDPSYAAAVAGVLAVGAAAFYAGLTPGQPTPALVAGVVVAVTLPATVAYELARRRG